MAGGSDEVEERMHSIVPETRISLDPGLFRKNVVVLTFEISNNLAKGSLIVDLISEARRVDDSE